MYCKKCGAQLADDQQFCGACGTPVLKTDGAEQGQPVQQPPETINNPQPGPAMMFAEKKPSPKGRKSVVLAAILAVVAILAVAAIVCIPMIKRALMSGQEVMAMHDCEIIEDGLESLSSAFKTEGKSTKYSGSIDVKLSDYLAGQLSSYIGDISSANIGFDVASKGEQYGCRITLSLSEIEIIAFDVTADIENDKLYITVPGFINGSLELDMGMFMPEDGKASVSSLVGNMSSLEISDKVIGDVLALIDAAYGASGDAVKGKEALTIDGISQNCTVYTLTIDEETAADMVVAVLKQLKKSENIKDFAGDLVEDYYAGLTREEIISEIDVFCDSGIESLTGEDITFSEDVIVYKMYVTPDEVVGRTVEINGVKLVAACVKNGRDMAFEYSVHQEFEGDVKLVGKGTDDKNGFTGEASLTVFEDEIVNLVFDKFSCDDEKLSGSVEITLGSEIAELDPYNEEVLSVLSTLKVTLDFDVKDGAGKIVAGLSLMNFDLGEIVLESSPDSTYIPSIPDNVAFSDPEEFADSVDIFAIFSKLVEAGLDISGLMGGMLG